MTDEHKLQRWQRRTGNALLCRVAGLLSLEKKLVYFNDDFGS